MSIITLTTDWKNNDFYVGALKGRLYSLCPKATVVDISHQIQSFNILQASFVLKNAYKQFPEGTIHIVGVNSDIKNNRLIVVSSNNHYFIGADNGVFSLIFNEKPDEIILIDNDKVGEESTFNALTSFSIITSHIVQQKPLERLGSRVESYKEHVPIRPAIDSSIINGSIIYIDSYSNAITNISKDLFARIGKQRPFDIFVQSNHYKINTLSHSYADVPVGELLAVFNSVDLLEVAIHNGNAAELLNLGVNSNVRVKFYDGTKTPELKLFNN
jgi:hypothetical protein